MTRLLLLSPLLLLAVVWGARTTAALTTVGAVR